MDVRGKRVLVVGLGRSGRAVALCLARRGAVVTVTDSKPPFEFQDVVPELAAQKIGLELGVHREETFLRQDLIVVSPGVPLDLRLLEGARRRLIAVMPEVEVASWFLKNTLVGVTGTNGKTTTTALLGQMLRSSGFPTFVGGNIGIPLSSAVDEVSADSLVLAELSSFQLEIIRDFHPDVAVLINLSPNHLDRHASFEAYVRAKARIFRNQTARDFAILNADDRNVMSLVPHIEGRKIFFTRTQNLPEGVIVSGGRILYRVGNLERELLATREVPLRGAFNVENVLAAAAAACVLGADFEALRAAVRDFRGVEHRLEFVREIRGVEFYNDSKATSVDATAKALSAFERNVHLILGGKDKGAPYAPLRPLIEGRVRYVFLIGAAAPRIAQELTGAAEMIRADELETAVRHAFKLAEPGTVVLLSPACASFDQFQDFQHRGRAFKDVVERLAREMGMAEAGGGNKGSGMASQEASGRTSLVTPNPKPNAATVHNDAVPRASDIVYMYEVRAEEDPPPNPVPSQDFEDVGPIAPGTLRALESVDDEALPFELRGAAAVRAGDDPTITSAAFPEAGVPNPGSLEAVADDGQVKRSPEAEKFPPNLSGGHSRLPDT